MPKATCSDSGCREQEFSRGLCRSHYGIAYWRGTLPPEQLLPGIHSLSNADRDTRTADCAVCGPQVPIRVRNRKGHGDIECATRVRERKRRWNQKQGPGPRHATKTRDRIREKYKITRDDYDRMVSDQQGRCAICHSEHPQLSVDHDHATGTVRGLLCNRCNAGIGFLRDDVDLLRGAIRYLTIRGSSA